MRKSYILEQVFAWFVTYTERVNSDISDISAKLVPDTPVLILFKLQESLIFTTILTQFDTASPSLHNKIKLY